MQGPVTYYLIYTNTDPVFRSPYASAWAHTKITVIGDVDEDYIPLWMARTGSIPERGIPCPFSVMGARDRYPCRFRPYDIYPNPFLGCGSNPRPNDLY